MFGFVKRYIAKNAPTPEKTASDKLKEARMQLFAAEQGVQDALTQADYWRRRVGFLEAIASKGVEAWSDTRAANGVDDRAVGRQTPIADNKPTIDLQGGSLPVKPSGHGAMMETLVAS